ncbi:translation initiation factor IF-3 [Candidatus Kaiserbacteria bacterium RIFCSPLOWO2_01_FULL_53_17]|uniref:Translation initiation factor IF-3 n=1 Tax=Candidatus Kaiserbacteria bacterium RIFCSPLOWO2_01_FULL_53_17 TaxID=1798511 RepID=A0A1F6EHM3_9BACT|nr:MAG: translation initiation factor IF-3 [Candidatus Kaiserbacteria bacterium RIFCSPLOWO2_01_FULL_53_17]
MGFTKYTTQAEKTRVRMNEGIRVPEVRCLGPGGENYGILKIEEALQKAKEAGLDLIEVSPNAQPPVCKITDYGKFKYEQNKKDKEIKSKTRVSETKEIQVKIGTSDNDMRIKAGKAAGWLKEGHRVKVDLFLWGRYKYMEFGFLKERLERFLAIIPESYKIADEIKKSPKGLSVALEGTGSKKSGPKNPPLSNTPRAPEETSAETITKVD